jgi:hypothetical protein
VQDFITAGSDLGEQISRGTLILHPVSLRVNSPKNNDASLLEPAATA